MKYTPLVLTAILTLSFTACDSKPAGSSAPPGSAAASGNPKEAFAAELNALGAEMTALQKKSAGGNPMDMMKEMPAILKKLNAVSTDGLPDDLKSAFGKMQKTTEAMVAAIEKIPADLPSDPAEMPAYMQSHPEAMKALMEMQSTMGPIQEEGDIARKEFEAAAKANDLDIGAFIDAGKEEAAEAEAEAEIPEPAPAPAEAPQ